MVKEPLTDEELATMAESLSRFIRDAIAPEMERQLMEVKFSIFDKLNELAARQNPVYYTRSEVCSKLGISLATFHNWVRTGELRTTKIKGRVYVDADALDAYMKHSKHKTTKK